jgi:putative transposase
MTDITALLQPLQSCMTQTTLRRLGHIIMAMLAMTGRVTMLGLARWAGPGGSYRSVQRFFYTVLPWGQMFWQFFYHHLWQPQEVYLLAGDESVVSKAGKKTFGLDRFFSSLLQRTVPGLSFFTLSLISVGERRSFPLWVEQVVRSVEEKAACQARKEAKKKHSAAPRRRPGRPKGSRNKNKADVPFSPELQRVQKMIQSLQQLIVDALGLTYLVLDGHFGHHPALQMVRQCGLQLISKLRANAALYFPYTGPYQGRGRRRQFGSRVDYRHLPESLLKATTVAGEIETRIYQAHLRHHGFDQLLNVVILLRSNQRTGAWAHVLLFSSDLALPWDKLVDYYGLRFQIEFNFRDAKQFWGLEDFMNVTQIAVSNAANLALFMSNVSQVLIAPFRQQDAEFSILDLKAHYRGYRYAIEMIKTLPQKPDDNFISRTFRQIAALGSIHPIKAALSSP